MENIGLFTVKSLWGNFAFDFAYSPSVGNSGGIVCVWDLNMFVKDNVSISDSFVAIRGTWVPTATKLLIVSVYAPQEVSERRLLWEYIGSLIEQWEGECVILGDFNEVRTEQERYGTVFNALGANIFNHFIASANLVDLPLEGYSFTWAKSKNQEEQEEARGRRNSGAKPLPLNSGAMAFLVPNFIGTKSLAPRLNGRDKVTHMCYHG
ncbi:RNA-directed DNA polymerase, eukaryota [Tanacetum coccineum]